MTGRRIARGGALFLILWVFSYLLIAGLITHAWPFHG